TISPGWMSTAETGLPSLQVADVWSHPGGTVWLTDTAEPGIRFVNVRLFDSAGSESSSSEKLTVPAFVDALNAKSCASFGVESWTTTRRPRLVLVKVQVIDSPGATSMLETGLP